MEEKLAFRASMTRLEEIVSLLEKNDIELEEAIALFEEGLKLVNSCNTQLQGCESRVNELIHTYQKVNGDE